MKQTEQNSLYDGLDHMSTVEILKGINTEDHKVPEVVAGCIPQISRLVDEIVNRVNDGGRVFYIGAGTSGRIGITDASEIPPTYGCEDVFYAIIAGGDCAIRHAKEGAEDNTVQGCNDIMEFNLRPNDTVIGISASGGAPYVLGAINMANELGVLTACITNNDDTPVAHEAAIPIVAVVGPEFVTGSTRMKAGTAAKLILNMISTAVMIKTGHVKGNHMVDMQLTNKKLVDRGTRMIMEETGINDYEWAKKQLMAHGSVRAAVDAQ